MFAHEIRTTLTSDLGAREWDWAVAVKDTAEHLTTLTTLIVDGARGERLALRCDIFRPRLFAEAVAASLSARAATKGLASETAIADDVPDVVCGDTVRLRAALENLIDNAVKFTDRGTVGLTVSTEPASRRMTKRPPLRPEWTAISASRSARACWRTPWRRGRRVNLRSDRRRPDGPAAPPRSSRRRR